MDDDEEMEDVEEDWTEEMALQQDDESDKNDEVDEEMSDEDGEGLIMRGFLNGRYIDSLREIRSMPLELDMNHEPPPAESYANLFDGIDPYDYILKAMWKDNGFRKSWDLKEMWRFLNAFKCCRSIDIYDNKFFENALLFLARMCFELNVSDSELVSEVLRYFRMTSYREVLMKELFEEDRLIHFPRNMLSFYFKSSHTTAEQESVRNVPFLYFVRHANKTKLCINNVHFLDQVLMESSGRPLAKYVGHIEDCHLLLTLFRHGAKLVPPMRYCEENEGTIISKMFRDFIVEILYLMVKSQAAQPGSRGIMDVFKMKSKVHRLSSIMNIIFRTITIPRLASIRNNECDFETNIKDVLDSVDLFEEIPPLKIRFLIPPRLQHFARCAIRERLYENWMLPEGISEIPIPSHLKEYVDLLQD